MSQPFVGEIRTVGFAFAPPGWLPCDGGLVSIADLPELFQLIGTTYGGDGSSTYAVPDLRSRVPVHQGQSGGDLRELGQTGGRETVTLTQQQMPAHRHAVGVAATRTSRRPSGALRAPGGSYGTPAASGAATTSAGSGFAHDNVPPVLVVSFIIATDGIFPSPS